jgi:hypothetical protein
MDYDPMDEKLVDLEACELAEQISQFVNRFGSPINEVVKHLSREHRTLQQGVTRFCVLWLEQCDKAYDGHNYDLRNEASVKLGKAFVSRITPQERAMPMI